jgi:hypothetical protein
MGKMALIMVFLASCFFWGLCLGEDFPRTFGKANGRYWIEVLEALPKETAYLAKAAYIQGYQDGLNVYANESASATKMLGTLEGIQMNEIVDAIDRIFGEVDNRDIPIHSILALECSKIKGEISSEDYDAVLLAMKKRYSE